MNIEMTSTVDVEGLARLVPQIVAFGRRTMREQCITSAYFICREAQNNTRFVEIGTIDAELEVEVTPRTKGGKVSKAKRPHHKEVTIIPGVRVPIGVLIVMARTDPESEYSKLTGNRWPLNAGMLPTGPGSGPGRAEMIRQWLERMTLARHSSTHFLQHGWAPAIKAFLSDPDYYAGARRRGLSSQSKLNPLNTMDHDDLGRGLIEGNGDEIMVMAENAVGGDGNAVLAKKHREALIEYGRAVLQEAIYKEADTMTAKIQDYIDQGMRQKFTDV